MPRGAQEKRATTRSTIVDRSEPPRDPTTMTRAELRDEVARILAAAIEREISPTQRTDENAASARANTPRISCALESPRTAPPEEHSQKDRSIRPKRLDVGPRESPSCVLNGARFTQAPRRRTDDG